MEIDIERIDPFLSILRETVSRFENLQESLTEAELKAKPDKKEWSPRFILAHLHSCQEVWGYSIRAMLILDEPTLAYIHPRAWTKRLGYRRLPFTEIFEGFKTRRAGLLRQMASFSEAEWSRSATMKGRIFTVFSQTRRMALHEEGHWPQLETFLMKS
jgi:hypothetical protein